ncbi:MAG: hypothetical protein Kow0059_18540 [Candidatus Sumerlaeia bacterium]
MHPRVRMKTTLGDIVLQLDGERAPISTLNFLRYAESGFYNGTIFHRVISNFMIQGGGYTADLTEKKQGQLPPIKNEWKNGLKNVRGTIAMARLGGRPDSATNQFFINVVDNPNLDKPNDGAGYAVFGKVIEGMDVVDKIRNTPVKEDPRLPMGKVVPVDTIVIESTTVLDQVDRQGLEKKAAQAAEASEKALREAQEKKKQAAETAKAAQEKSLSEFIKKIEAETGKTVQRRPSGLMFITLREGTGPSPKPTDRVEVHYEGKLLDGTVFDSSYKRGAPSRFQLTQVVQGWTEGLGLMKVGGESLLIVPSHLGYGEQGRGVIPPNAALVFRVELLAIVND